MITELKPHVKIDEAHDAVKAIDESLKMPKSANSMNQYPKRLIEVDLPIKR